VADAGVQFPEALAAAWGHWLAYCSASRLADGLRMGVSCSPMANVKHNALAHASEVPGRGLPLKLRLRGREAPREEMLTRYRIDRAESERT